MRRRLGGGSTSTWSGPDGQADRFTPAFFCATYFGTLMVSSRMPLATPVSTVA
jgi:hypothetical protein